MARRDRHKGAQPGGILPDVLRDALEAIIPGEVEELAGALQAPPPISIRLNRAKPFGPAGEAVPWCATGRYLGERPVFTLDPLLHAGAYYVQEAASMLLEQAVLATGLGHRDIVALDLCAAPGGKSTHLRSLLTPGSLLVANEVDGRRRAILAENLWKWGLHNVVITGAATRAFTALPASFDLVLVDAPCSGEGMFRKDAFARQQWGPALVRQCAATQAGIVAHAWEALRPGGYLIYSTCTWEPAENEDQLVPLLALGAEPIPIPAAPDWGTRPSVQLDIHALRCYPHHLRGEGFFISVMRKPGMAAEVRNTPPPSIPSGAAVEWIDEGTEQAWIEQGDVLHAVDGRHAGMVEALRRVAVLSSPGLPVAERKAGEWRPHPALALSTRLRREAFQVLDLSRTDALDYLRGQALPSAEARGTALVTHQGLALGWAQGAGRRWNNGWPQPWRIRMRAT